MKRGGGVVTVFREIRTKGMFFCVSHFGRIPDVYFTYDLLVDRVITGTFVIDRGVGLWFSGTEVPPTPV